MTSIMFEHDYTTLYIWDRKLMHCIFWSLVGLSIEHDSRNWFSIQHLEFITDFKINISFFKLILNLTTQVLNWF